MFEAEPNSRDKVLLAMSGCDYQVLPQHTCKYLDSGCPYHGDEQECPSYFNAELDEENDMTEVFCPEPCPEARRLGDVDYCANDDRVCNLELGLHCNEYQDYLAKLDEEEDNV